jgi:hypothetical protein
MALLVTEEHTCFSVVSLSPLGLPPRSVAVDEHTPLTAAGAPSQPGAARRCVAPSVDITTGFQRRAGQLRVPSNLPVRPPLAGRCAGTNPLLMLRPVTHAFPSRRHPPCPSTSRARQRRATGKLHWCGSRVRSLPPASAAVRPHVTTTIPPSSAWTSSTGGYTCR